MRKSGRILALVSVFGLLATAVSAQQIEQVTFDEAVRRAVANNPTIQQAAAGIMRAEALLRQARSRALPSLDVTFNTNVIDPVTQFSGQAINPRTQTATSASFSAPLLAAVRWAERAQAGDQVLVAQATATDTRKQLAVSTAEAYLAVISQKRQLELNERARETAQGHFDYANQRYEGGLGSRLNMLRAQQELSADEATVEDARLALRRTQEALGILVAADAPVDAAAEPSFDVGPDTDLNAAPLSQRTDVRLVQTRESAARRVVSDSWKDRLPSLTALFTPQVLAPSGLFSQARSWEVQFSVSIPVFDAGQRSGQAYERRALLDSVRFERANLERQATSEIRVGREAVRLTVRALERARQSADQANEVVRITDIAFREGASTNLEVIDAQRSARDAETTAEIAADAARRAQLELLISLGRFPQ